MARNQRQTTVTVVRNHVLDPPLLPERSVSDVCQSYLDGFCNRGEHCSADHAICRISQVSHELPQLGGRPVSSVNFLDMTPRRAPPSTELFDCSGPGELCSESKPRHDNDYIDIRKIQILPTTDEILCKKAPYMPAKSFKEPHFLSQGQDRLIDTLFRQLRYDSTEAVIDISYRASQLLVTSFLTPDAFQAMDIRQETPQGNRFSFLQEVEFEDIFFNRNKGLIVRVSFKCPPHLKGAQMHRSKLFESGMLVSLVGLNTQNKALSVTFFDVHLRESSDSHQRKGKGLRASIQLSFAQAGNQDDIRRILMFSQGVLCGRFALVEYPGVLLAGYAHCLEKLQTLSGKNVLPFAQHLASDDCVKTKPVCPPAYAQRDGFEFDLSPLCSSENATAPLVLPMGSTTDSSMPQQDFLQRIKRETTLDDGQASALLESVHRALAFVQGPPGTGKTFLGVSLVKTLLKSLNKSGESPAPILAVCMTNHALDSFLADLKASGIDKIARLGGGSREDWTKPHLLRALAQKQKMTQLESSRNRNSLIAADGLEREGVNFCESLDVQSGPSWQAVREHLSEKYPSIYSQFASLEVSEELSTTNRIARNAGGFGFHCWKTGFDFNALRHLALDFTTYLGLDLTDENTIGASGAATFVQNMLEEMISSARNVTDLSASDNVWSMSPKERSSLLETWRQEIGPQILLEKAAEIHRRHYVARNKVNDVRAAINLRCLQQQRVIGVTTTASAKYWDLLNQLNMKVVICEEAGEVMEAHTLCHLFPSVEHAIFIGDPLQLRPHITGTNLSLETPTGQRYRLDESLFERLTQPADVPDHSHNRNDSLDHNLVDSQKLKDSLVPYSRLNLQRRMHPDIADICRATLYPFVQDHESTGNHPVVTGMANRMFWFSHRHQEDTSDPTSVLAKSFANSFEVEMVAGLVRHLLAQNQYALGDIAILTPYNGQLSLLTKRLASDCSIYLNEKDKSTLQDAGLVSAEDLKTNSTTVVKMGDMLRLATIDNFQGEEAKIIIMTTVRSNPKNTVGFLKSSNRINVACSRARDGFYIIGNDALMSQVPMWAKIIELFRQKRLLGPSFSVNCPRHTYWAHQIKDPSDFASVPECSMICESKLACGHNCKERCHPDVLHEQLECLQQCQKTHAACGHPCENICKDDCGVCQVQIPTHQLPCGHQTSAVCGQISTAAGLLCKEVIANKELPCGHSISIRCSEQDDLPPCSSVCLATLECGHSCQEKCASCQASSTHHICQKACKKEHDCGHACPEKCHVGPCPPCQERCGNGCTHGGCEKLCHEVCDPCLKPCARGCPHQGACTAVCCLPCTKLPCSETCTKVLPCGHSCPSLCNEPCSKICEECSTWVAPTVPQLTLDCGHIVSVKEMDAHANISTMYTINHAGQISGFKQASENSSSNSSNQSEARPPMISLQTAASITSITCPTCSSPVLKVPRYLRFAQLKSLPKLLDDLLCKFGKEICDIERMMRLKEEQLDISRDEFLLSIRRDAIGAEKNHQELRERADTFIQEQNRIKNLRDDIVSPIEQYLRVSTDVHLRSHTSRLSCLMIRCRLITLTDTLQIVEYIQSMPDCSRHLSVLGRGLQVLVAEQSQRQAATVQAAISCRQSDGLLSLEVEWRILQLKLDQMVKRFGAKSQVDGQRSTRRALHLCRTCPQTVGKLSKMVELAGRGSEGPQEALPAWYPDREAADYWKAWGSYEVGHLEQCPNGHPFSTATFPACPECGQKAKRQETSGRKAPAPDTTDYDALMPVDKFKQWMLTMA